MVATQTSLLLYYLFVDEETKISEESVRKKLLKIINSYAKCKKLPKSFKNDKRLDIFADKIKVKMMAEFMGITRALIESAINEKFVCVKSKLNALSHAQARAIMAKFPLKSTLRRHN